MIIIQNWQGFFPMPENSILKKLLLLLNIFKSLRFLVFEFRKNRFTKKDEILICKPILV